MTEINNFTEIINKYQKNVAQIDLDMKKKYFKLSPYSDNKLNITSYDDMYDILYIKNKYLNKDVYKHINKEVSVSNNIINDLIKLLKNIFDINYFDDNEFKYVTKQNDLDYLNPKIGEYIIYNSLKKNTFQQSDFRKNLYAFEEKIKEYLLIKFNYNIKVNFFEDEEYKLVWMIVEISKNKN